MKDRFFLIMFGICIIVFLAWGAIAQENDVVKSETLKEQVSRTKNRIKELQKAEDTPQNVDEIKKLKDDLKKIRYDNRQHIIVTFIMLLVSFVILLKSANYFVDGAVGIAETLRVPKMLVGIILVGFGTTAPEFAVSVQSAMMGKPEIALGNAVGSVICDDAVALALAATIIPIIINPKIFKTAAPFLIGVDIIAYLLSFDGTVARWEGLVLVVILIGYLFFVIREQKRIRARENIENNNHSTHTSQEGVSTTKAVTMFALGLVGVIIASRIVIISAVQGEIFFIGKRSVSIISIAENFHVPEIVIGLTMIAIGTSLPEIMTCVTAAIKKEGEIAAGDIIGADILNILWIIGVSAAVNPITVPTNTMHFSFISMFVVVIITLVFMRTGWKVSRKEGVFLIFLYVIYIALMIKFFGIQAAAH